MCISVCLREEKGKFRSSKKKTTEKEAKFADDLKPAEKLTPAMRCVYYIYLYMACNHANLFFK